MISQKINLANLTALESRIVAHNANAQLLQLAYQWLKLKNPMKKQNSWKNDIRNLFFGSKHGLDFCLLANRERGHDLEPLLLETETDE